MSTQEELIALFQRNFSLQQPTYVAPPKEAPKEEPIIYSISQHYHHSAHVARPASEPPQTDQLTTEIILARHGVDVNTLLPTQLELFKTADSSQQMRLIELWRICPPDYRGNVLPEEVGQWPHASFEQEEAMAKLRYERQMLEERMSRAGMDHSMESDTMSDSSTQGPLTPIQGGDGRWNQMHSAEPYMQSGYEALAQQEYERSAATTTRDSAGFGASVGGIAYNHSTDPVYRTVEELHKPTNDGGDWSTLMQQQQQAMENQYGAFEQFQHEGVAVTSYQGVDHEMF